MGIFGIYRGCLGDNLRQDANRKWRAGEAALRAPRAHCNTNMFSPSRDGRRTALPRRTLS
jgi:hypothetical protein